MTLAELAHPERGYSYAFLDEFAKRELRRRILKAIAIPGYQVPYASRELPIARGWGTGGLQVTLSLVGPDDVIKVIDQGADDSVNAANLRRFITRVSNAAATTDALKATLIQSRHRIPEERLGEDQVLVLQVPDPEPMRHVEHDISKAREMHADADYGLVVVDAVRGIGALSSRDTRGQLPGHGAPPLCDEPKPHSALGHAQVAPGRAPHPAIGRP